MSSHPTSERTFQIGQVQRIQVVCKQSVVNFASQIQPRQTNNIDHDFGGGIAAKILVGREAANAFRRRPIEIQIRSEWNLGVLSFRPTLKCFWLERFPKGKA